MSYEKKLLLSVRDLKVQFRVRGRILTAIRGISLDIFEDECIAIVGESGSGKSVFTKTFAGMLDSNGFISQGSIIFHDDELSDVTAPLSAKAAAAITELTNRLCEAEKLRFGVDIWRQILTLESEKRQHDMENAESAEAIGKQIADLKTLHVKLFNERQTLDPAREKDRIKAVKQELKSVSKQLKELEKQKVQAQKNAKAASVADNDYNKAFKTKLEALKASHAEKTKAEITSSMKAEAEVLAKEVYLSTFRFKGSAQKTMQKKLLDALSDAMKLGVDLSDEDQKNKVFDTVTYRVGYASEDGQSMKGCANLNLAHMESADDWTRIRGRKIATVFQDPMTSLNPIITIGNQISSIIMKHQNCTESDARIRAIELMAKVGIPNAASRYDDYPFQYSGGMRQRIVIAIALSCQPKILICDEPTTALDVTIQAQILKLIKDLQKEFHYTTVFITHDLGVVANVADRVAVLYAGQLVEVGTVEEVFYDPRHPYTWALLSSLPQLAERNTVLYSITGTPPSLYNEIKGDAFAPRNPYCLKIDTLAEPPMFQVSETHFAKTWLLHPDAPKVSKPEGIEDIHGKLMKAFNI